jgi:ribosome-binding factor A
MERRNQQYHRERMGEALREEIGAIVEGELGDPRIGLAVVTEVHVGPDGKSAHVLVNVSGDDNEVEQTLAGLDAARPYIKRELVSRLRLRHAPELYFQLDRAQQHESRIDELLRRVNKRKK